MVKRLYDIIFLFKEYVVVSFCLLISILLLALNDSPQIRVLRSYAVVGVGLLQNVVSVVPNYFSLRQEISALRAANLALADEVSRLREGKLENLRLHQMLALKQRGEHRYIAANVVGKNLQLLRNTITLDAGELEGVRVNMPIVSESGLVGKVVSTSGHYAVGQILLNKDLRVSAKVQRSRVDGIIRWNGGTTLQLQEVARTMDVQVGDLVVTSEYSAYYPEGTRIGIVSRAEPIPGSLFQGVEVSPSVDFTHLEEAFVLVHLPDSTRSALEQRSQEPYAASGR
jgi:rod shape-determining protein MreC